MKNDTMSTYDIRLTETLAEDMPTLCDGLRVAATAQ